MSIFQDVERGILYVTGRIDASNAQDLDSALVAMEQAAGGSIIVDLAKAVYISSSGLRCLLLAHRRQLSAGCYLRLRAVPPRIMHILSIGGLDRVLNVVSASEA